MHGSEADPRQRHVLALLSAPMECRATRRTENAADRAPNTAQDLRASDRPNVSKGVGMSVNRSLESRVKYLKLALQEAVRTGDKLAAKRLTAHLTKILYAPTNQARTH